MAMFRMIQVLRTMLHFALKERKSEPPSEAKIDTLDLHVGDCEALERVKFTCILHCRPMSIVYYFPPEHLTYFEELRATTELRPNMNIAYVIQEDPDFFPINSLRNLAIENAQTTHFWLADMDVWPTSTLVAVL